MECAVSELEDRWKERWGDEAPVIDCGPGWDELLLNLDDELMKIAPDYTILQVKEKFGTLRFYASCPEGTNFTKFDGLITTAELASAITCERCGRPGTLRNRNGWYKTLCEKHADGTTKEEE